MMDQLRELDDAEAEQVSGGKCMCGANASCATTKTKGYSNGTTTSTTRNCAGIVVGFDFW